MPNRICFHLDEQMDPEIAEALRQVGIVATTAREAGLLGASDRSHLRHARRSGSVIVTDDSDFLRLAATAPKHAGIIFCRRTRRTTGQIIQFLILAHSVFEPHEFRGRIEYL